MLPPNNGSATSSKGLLMTLLGVLDLLTTGVAVTTIRGRLLFMNRTSEEILSTRDGLEISAGDILCQSNEGSPLPVEAMLSAQRGRPMPSGSNGITASVC